MREDLVGATGGNPLALLELPVALTDDERTGRAPLRLDLPLNERIERAFMVRVEPLGDDARRLLVLAAADDSGDVGTLLRASERLGFGPDALDIAERAGLLTVQGTRLRFRHPLVRSAVYRAAGFAERRAAHEALAAVLEDGADVDRRAWHRAAAATAPDDDAAEALVLTADHAASRGGHTAAARALERAAELDSDPQRRAEHLVAAAVSSAMAGRFSHAEALLDRAEPELRDPMVRATAARVRGMVSMAVGRPADAFRLLADAARTLLPADRPAGLGLLMRACMAAAVSGEPEAIHRMLAELDTEPRSDAELFPSRLMNGISRLIAGDAAAGAASVEEALALADDLEILEQVQQAGGGAIFVGDWGRARRYFDRAIVMARDRGAVAVLLETLGLRAVIALWERRLADAAADADEAVRLADDIGAGNALAVPVTVLAWLAGLRGDEEACRRHADAVLALAIERGLALPAGLATWALAQLDLAAGRWNEALLRLTAIEEVRPGFGHPFLPVLSSWDRVEAAVWPGVRTSPSGRWRASRRGPRSPRRRGRRRCWPTAARSPRPPARPMRTSRPRSRASTARGRSTARASICTTASTCAASAAGSTPASICAPRSRASSGSARPRGPSARCASCAPPARRPASATSARWPSSRRRSCRSRGSSATARRTRRSHRSSS